jgi:citrate lyase subunit beta-like protein
MLSRSLSSPADSICYDLEDSVSPTSKTLARSLLLDHLNLSTKPQGEVMVRINAIGTGYEKADLEAVLSTKNIQAIALPKTESVDHILWVIDMIKKYGKEGVKVIGMIESARGMMRIREIAECGKGYLDGLVVG